MQNRNLFSMIESYIDMLINLVALIVSYVFVLFFNEHTIDLKEPLVLVIVFGNIIFLSFVYHLFNVYRASRYSRQFHSIPEILKVNFVFFGIMVFITAFTARESLRGFILYWYLFWFLTSTAFLTFKRHAIKTVLKYLRKRQFHLKKVIIIGDNTLTASEYVSEAMKNAQNGIMVLGYVGDRMDENEVGVDKLGGFQNLAEILDKYKPTEVVFAIDSYDKRRLIKLVNMCDDRCIKVFFLPVIYGYFKTPNQIEKVGSLPVINIHSTPLDNRANALLKRLVDIAGSLALILITLPIMIAVAIGVRLSSPGPILFKQKRVGKMGKIFTMYKFRSMVVNNEQNLKWTTDTDTRKTKFGNFIRKTSIDELPQLFNVLFGSMSLVGPRPEIPVFVEHFKEIIPLYMVKHYVKPGMTGLAQVKGLRGDTSVVDRIHEDIEYIENWSMLLDIQILLQTPLKAINKNEKLAPKEEESKESSTDENSGGGEENE